MQDITHMPSGDRELLFDRLADGELSGEEYRQFIASLDGHPAEWRRCAMAFLESQALSQDLLRQDLGECDFAGKHEAKSLAGRRNHVSAGRRLPWRLFLAVAASFLVAFSLGRAYQADSGDFNSLDAGNENANVADVGGDGFRPVPDSSTSQLAGTAFGTASSGTEILPAGNVEFVMDGGNDDIRQFQLPYYELNPQDAQWLSPSQSAVPRAIVEELKRRGQQITSRRELVPIELGDGRRMVVPVEDVQIMPISRPIY